MEKMKREATDGCKKCRLNCLMKHNQRKKGNEASAL